VFSMCYHNSISAKPIEVQKRYQTDFDDPGADYILFHENGFNHLPRPVLASKPRRIEMYRWGLIPRWTRSSRDAATIQNKTLNAVSETVFERPSFREAIVKRRCLVPSTGFFEWMHHGGKKYPFSVKVSSAEIFSMAGIYEHWTDPESSQQYQTFSILTCPANQLMAKVHNSKLRMPVILPLAAEKDWLDPNLPKRDIEALMQPYPEDDMKAHSIAPLISSRSENSNVPEISAPFEYPGVQRQIG
jgi:putative SOS response-associated peptidase YedK